MAIAAPNAAIDGSLTHSSGPRVSVGGALASPPRWTLIFRGFAGLAFGVIAFTVPGITFLMLIAMFAGYLLVDGILAIASGLGSGGEGKRWWPFVVEGVANLAMGGLAIARPGATALAIVYMVAIWSILTGVLLMFPNPEHGPGTRIAMALAGLCSMLLGAAMIAQPVAGSFAIVWLSGIYGLVFGGLLLVAGSGTRPAESTAGAPS